MEHSVLVVWPEFRPDSAGVQAISTEKPRTLPEKIPIINKEQVSVLYTMTITIRLKQKVYWTFRVLVDTWEAVLTHWSSLRAMWLVSSVGLVTLKK